MMTREQVVAHYAERTGRRGTAREWAWYEVFGLFREAVTAQQVHQRYLAGRTTNPQCRLLGVAVVLPELWCRRIIARARRLDDVRAAAPVGSSA